jgi:hypothetical protein
MRDNHKHRKSAYYSATGLLGCPRATALQSTYDYYEALETGWNKYRGTLIHFMMEHDPEPKAGVIKEQRFYKIVSLNGMDFIVTGQPDYVDPELETIIDYKSTNKLPDQPKVDHIAQVNIYAWLLKGGKFMNEDGVPLPSDKIIDLTITRGGMHYVTFNTKAGTVWRKVGAPIWPVVDTEALILERLAPLAAWKHTNQLPHCDPYVKGRWTCDCEKIEKQLEEVHGITVR